MSPIEISPEQAQLLYEWAKRVTNRMNFNTTEDWGGEVNEIQPTIDEIENPPKEEEED